MDEQLIDLNSEVRLSRVLNICRYFNDEKSSNSLRTRQTLLLAGKVAACVLRVLGKREMKLGAFLCSIFLPAFAVLAVSAS